MAILILTVPEGQRQEMEAEAQDTSNKPTQEQLEEDRYWAEYAKRYPCIGCGYCCRKRPCGVAQYLNKMDEDDKGEYRCTMLQWVEEDQQYRCRFLLDPETEHYAHEIHIGVGCCSTLFNQDREKIPHPSECGWGHIL